MDLLLAGVGGQGIILASEIMGEVAFQEDYEVKINQIYGMAQRGGSVLSQVRFAPQVYSPVISPGEADFLLAFEKLEALRWMGYLKKEGIIIINNQNILPPSLIAQGKSYPEEITQILKKGSQRAYLFKALAIAQSCGGSRSLNMVMLGALSLFLEFKEKSWKERIRKHFPSSLSSGNILAFESGRKSLAHLISGRIKNEKRGSLK